MAIHLNALSKERIAERRCFACGAWPTAAATAISTSLGELLFCLSCKRDEYERAGPKVAIEQLLAPARVRWVFEILAACAGFPPEAPARPLIEWPPSSQESEGC